MSVRLAVFDCDGTLSDGQAAVCSAMTAAFAEAGLLAPDLHRVRRSVGHDRRMTPTVPGSAQTLPFE